MVRNHFLIIVLVSFSLNVGVLANVNTAPVRFIKKPGFTIYETRGRKKTEVIHMLIDPLQSPMSRCECSNAIALHEWGCFTIRFSREKNSYRYIFINNTLCFRSHSLLSEHLPERGIEGGSCLKMAQPTTVRFIQSKADMSKRGNAYWVVKA